MTKSLDQLRRDAKALKKAHEAGETHARQRLLNYPPRSDGADLKHADYLHVIARENSFESWPQLKLAAELHGMDRAARQQRLKIAVAHGQGHVIDRLLSETPDLAQGLLGVQIALYDRWAVEAALDTDPAAATRPLGPRPAMCHLAFSRYIHIRPDLEADMLAIAEMLVAHGASVDAAMPVSPDSDHRLSALYGAIGHANNMVLGRWLLEHGANPNDGESLYHATELGHHEGLGMLLDHGADPAGTNALLRAMDFDDVKAVRMLLDAGAQADEFNGTHVGGERPWVIPALHQAARRMCSREMIELLLDAGADPTREFEGMTPYAYARVFGNRALAEALEARGHDHPLGPVESVLAQIAENDVPAGTYVNPDTWPDEIRNIVRMILHLPEKLEHVKRLVAAGVEYDRPDGEGLTPVQVAGWEGLPDVLLYFLSLKPDLTHVNNYGGTLLSTIIHGSENNPHRAERDYIACLRIVLDHGVALPRRAVELAGDPEVSEFLADWAEAHPGQVVDGGVA